MNASRAAYLSMAIQIGLLAAKLWVWVLTASVAVLSEAAHSGLDVVAAFLVVVAVSQAARPPDGDHRFGHGKFESMGGLMAGVLILLAAPMIGYEAVISLVLHREPRIVEYGVAVMLVSGGLNTLGYIILSTSAKRHASLSLKGDAYHHLAEAYTSFGVSGALAVMYLAPRVGLDLWYLDAAAGLIIAGVTLLMGAGLVRPALSDLLDRGISPEDERKLHAVMKRHEKEYLNIHNVRTRYSGPEAHIDMHMTICRGVSVEDSHALCDSIERGVRSVIPRSQVLVHVEPCDHAPGECPPVPGPGRPGAERRG